MNEQSTLVLALGVVGVCSIVVVLMLPALAVAAARGNRAGAVRLTTLLVVLAVIALAVSTTIGASPGAYLLLT